jgi:PAS domain S-box-containing protein
VVHLPERVEVRPKERVHPMSTRADILVIDDDPMVREAVGDVLRNQGHHVDRVDRGKAALERIGRQRPVDLAIVDFKLPDISGLELLRSIKTRSPETEVIVMTGHASLDGVLAAIEGEASSYLVKPVNARQLLSTVDRALARQSVLRALRDSEERYRLIAESMTEALFLLDLEGGLLMVNSYGEQLSGFRSDELMGRPVFALLDASGALVARQRLEDVRAGREVAPQFECQMVRKDGTHVPVELTCTSIARDGDVVGRLVVARDVTDRRQAQAAQALLSSIVESSEDAIIGRSLEGRIVSWNPAAERLYGYSAAEAIGQPVSLIVPVERRDELSGILAGVGNGRVHTYETIRRTKDGRRIAVSLTMSPIKDASGRVIGSSSTARDITDRRRAERTARALAQVGRELLGTLDLGQIADRIVRSVLDVFQAGRAVLYEHEPVSRTLVCLAAAGPDEPAQWVGTHLPAGVGIAWRAVSEERVVASAGVLADPAAAPAGPAEESGQSVIAVPLMAGGRVLGALLVGGAPDRTYSADEQQLLSLFGDQAALALHNAQRFTETERGRRIAERVAAVTRSVPQSVTLTELARRIAEGLCGLLHARTAVVYRLEPASWSLVRIAAGGEHEPPLGTDAVLPRGAGLEGVAASTRQPVVTADLLGDPRVTLSAGARAEVEQSAAGAGLALPLIVQGRMIGAVLVRDRTGRRWTGEDIALGRAFADQAAIALENSHLYQSLHAALDDIRASQQRLIESERLRAVGSLAEGVTDYVRQVLQMILGKVQLVRPGTAGSEDQDRLASIKATVMEAAKVLNRVQAFAEVRTLTEAPPLDFNDVVEAAVEMIRSRGVPGRPSEAPPVEIQLETVPLPSVAGEATPLIESVGAILVNAAEAMPDGGTIAVRTWATADEVHCAVRDPGVGMSAETRQRALEPFFTTKAGEHKGLGLSVAYGLLRRHRGELDIASAEGKGTVVTLRLPVLTPPGS